MNGVRATVRPREQWRALCKPAAPTSRKVSPKCSEVKIIQLGEITTPAVINITDQQQKKSLLPNFLLSAEGNLDRSYGIKSSTLFGLYSRKHLLTYLLTYLLQCAESFLRS